MEKSNKIILGITIVCVIAVMVICGIAIYNHKEEVMSDAMKFKNEYEAFNGLVNEVNNKRYLEVNISDDNPFLYRSSEEIVDILKKENAIVYFGYATCPWCRNLINPMIDASKASGISKIYYVDIYDIRDTYSYDKNKKEVVQNKKGTDAYYDILEFLDESLDEFYVLDEKEKRHDTGVKRLNAPTVIAVSHGKVIDIHISTIDTQEDPYDELNKEQKQKLQERLEILMKSLKFGNVCDGTSC